MMKRKLKKLVVIIWMFVSFAVTGYIVHLSTRAKFTQVWKSSRSLQFYFPKNNENNSDVIAFYVKPVERRQFENRSLSFPVVTVNAKQAERRQLQPHSLSFPVNAINAKPAERRQFEHYDVLLNSYMNSGSTFTGRLLGFHKDSFYFYEPLWHISLWSYYRSNSTLCSTKITYCRGISRGEMNRNKPIPKRKLDLQLIHDIDINKNVPIAVPQRILDHIYNCNLSKLINLVQPGVTSKDTFSGHSWEKFRQCERLRKPVEQCLTELEVVCSKAKHRVSKVLRITLGGLESVLRNNPKLKVLHLFRDPRAIINSRMETKGYPLKFNPRGNKDISQNAKALCDKMTVDFEEGEKLMEKFPDRFRFIHYEDLALNLDSIIKVYEYIGMAYDKASFSRVYAVKTNDPERQLGDRERERRNNNALWWRRYLPYDIIKEIDIVCYAVYGKLGYPLFKNMTHLRDTVKMDGLVDLKFKL